MIIKNEIELHNKSLEYIKETFDQYEEVYALNKVRNPIIHIYPKHDTYDSNGELNGYIDALFSEIHIYDTKNMTVFKSKYHDAIIPFTELKVLQIKAFKDLSYMIALSGEYEISRGTALSIGLADFLEEPKPPESRWITEGSWK